MTAPANACACHACASACAHKPGWFTPDQIAPLAEALGLTEKELFDQHLMVDVWMGDEATNHEDVFVLSPAVVNGLPGGMFDFDPRGRCHWLKDGKCAIHELGKPFECATYHHSMEEGGGKRADTTHRDTALAWDNPEAQAKIRELLGHEPYLPEPESIFEMLGLLF